MTQTYQRTTKVTTFSARRYYQESACGALTPQGSIVFDLAIPESGITYLPDKCGSLKWVDGLYGDYLSVREFIKAIDQRELPPALSGDRDRLVNLKITHSSAELIASSDQTVLSALNLVEQVISSSDPRQMSVCPGCRCVLTTTPNAAALQAKILADHLNQEVTLEARAANSLLSDWAARYGVTTHTAQGDLIRITLDTLRCTAERLIDLSRLIQSLLRLPGVILAARSDSSISHYSTTGWCNVCSCPGTSLNKGKMRELLSRGADLQQPLPLEAHYQLYPQLSLIQILSESYANIAAPAESFLNPALAILRDLKLEGLSLGSRINALSTKEIALITIAASLLAPEQQRELIVIDLPRGSLPATHRLAVEKAIKSYSHSSSTVILGDPWHTDLKSSQGSPRQLQISKSRQTLGSALGITDKLAKLYAASLDARSNGLTERSFSLTAPRSNPYICSECSGLGVKLDYSLNLPRPRASGCPVCHGARFKAPVASTLFRGVPYYQILNQPITSSLSVLGALSRMKATLEQITDNGLAELPLGIPIALLSSSERSLLAL